jgi:aspartate aminotransferase
MLNSLEALPPDPILGLSLAFQEDPRSEKIDLGVGVYRDESGDTPVMRAVKAAEKQFLEEETTKAYIPQVGVAEFNAGVLDLVLGRDHPAMVDGRASTVLTPGGTGALRIGAELIKRIKADATVWVGDPTWANHTPILKGAGVNIATFPYYDKESSTVLFSEMLEALDAASPGDAVLVHGCCHNPCGADLGIAEWRQLADLVVAKGLLPFIDLAYQGFGEGLDEDAAGVRLVAEKCPEVLIASSCSKNFGLYRERTGSLTSVAQSAEKAKAAQSHATNVARAMYSMPPAHGAFLAGMVLQQDDLRQTWQEELTAMRNRMNELRALFVRKMADKGSPRDFSFIEQQFGMFSFLGIDKERIQRLRDEFGIYMVGSSRVNIAGISETNIDHLTDSLVEVLKDG